jgi:hypothetical protein
LLRRGPQQFLRDKLLRIGLPWVFGVLFVAPPLTYLIYLSRGIAVGLLEFWRTDFWGDMYQQAVYWFLGVLLVLFLAIAVLYDSPTRRASFSRQPALPSPVWLVGFVGLTAAAFLLMNQYYPLDTWLKVGYVWVVQPERVPLYIAYFALGVYAYQHAWFLPGGYRPPLDTWALWCALSGALYLSYRLTYPPALQTTLTRQAANAALFNVFCFSSLMAGIALFRRQTAIPEPVWNSLAANSFGVYYVHPLVVYPLAYILRSLSFPMILKAIMLIGVSIGLSWSASALLLRRAPVLRRVFAGLD